MGIMIESIPHTHPEWCLWISDLPLQERISDKKTRTRRAARRRRIVFGTLKFPSWIGYTILPQQCHTLGHGSMGSETFISILILVQAFPRLAELIVAFIPSLIEGTSPPIYTKIPLSPTGTYESEPSSTAS